MNGPTQGDATDGKRELLRHTIATVAYRGGKVLRSAPDGFAEFRVVDTSRTRTPGKILAHIGDLFDWALSLAQGKPEWHNSKPLSWDEGTRRFFAAVEKLDAYLASNEPLGFPAEKIFQGPVADSLTHIGQIAMLRRLAGAPVRAEDYQEADIAVGRVGAAQSPPRFEFE